MVISAPLSERAASLHAGSIVIDCCTQFCEGYDERLEKTGITILNTTVVHPNDDTDDAVKRIATYYELLRRDSKLRLVQKVDDIFQAKADGVVGIIIAFQNARPLSDSPALVEVFHRLGTRVVQLSYSCRNFAADGCLEPANAGLSADGRALVRELNRLGIVVDLSHVGERSSLDAIEISEKPPIFSHSNPRSRVDVRRNITDEQIRAVAAKGGVVCLTPYPPLNWIDRSRRPTLGDYLDNIEYVVDLVGIDYAGIGTDSEATAGAFPRELRIGLRRKYMDTYAGYYDVFQNITLPPTIEGYGGLQDFPVFTQGLVERGYNDDAIRKILGLNLIRVFREVWG